MTRHSPAKCWTATTADPKGKVFDCCLEGQKHVKCSGDFDIISHASIYPFIYTPVICGQSDETTVTSFLGQSCSTFCVPLKFPQRFVLTVSPQIFYGMLFRLWLVHPILWLIHHKVGLLFLTARDPPLSFPSQILAFLLLTWITFPHRTGIFWTCKKVGRHKVKLNSKNLRRWSKWRLDQELKLLPLFVGLKQSNIILSGWLK